MRSARVILPILLSTLVAQAHAAENEKLNSGLQILGGFMNALKQKSSAAVEDVSGALEKQAVAVKSEGADSAGAVQSDYPSAIGAFKVGQIRPISVYRDATLLTLGERTVFLDVDSMYFTGSFGQFLKSAWDRQAKLVAPGRQDGGAGPHNLNQGMLRQLFYAGMANDQKALRNDQLRFQHLLDADFVLRHFKVEEKSVAALREGRISYGKQAIKGDNEFQRERNWQQAVNEIESALRGARQQQSFKIAWVRVYNLGAYDMKAGYFPLTSAHINGTLNPGSGSSFDFISGGGSFANVVRDWRIPDALRCAPDVAERLTEEVQPVKPPSGTDRNPLRPVFVVMDVTLTYKGDAGGSWVPRLTGTRVFKKPDFSQEVKDCQPEIRPL